MATAKNVSKQMSKAALYKACLIDTKMAQRIERIKDDIIINNDMMDLVIDGTYKSALIYGGAGMGKTHLLVSSMARHGITLGKDWLFGRCQTSPIIFYQMLWSMRKAGQFVVVDDSDALLRDEDGINLLKGAMDPTYRQVSWNTKSNVKALDGTIIPKSFEFHGTVIVCTNISYGAKQTTKMAQHFSAIRSRTNEHIMDYTDKDDQYAYVAHLVLDLCYLDRDPQTQLTHQQKVDMLRYIMANRSLFHRLDARYPEKIARLMVSRPTTWEAHARRQIVALNNTKTV